MNALGVVNGETDCLEEEGREKDRRLLMLETMGELQQSKRGVKPNELGLAGRYIHATVQHVLLNAALFLRKVILFAGLDQGSRSRWNLTNPVRRMCPARVDTSSPTASLQPCRHCHS